MAGAYYEKIARINLTTGKIKVEPLDLELAHKFIGGRGLGTKMLYDEGIATVDPLSPENKLIYITGPMTGAAAPSTGRYMVCTKSPLTGMIACSNSGGIWGAKRNFGIHMDRDWRTHRDELVISTKAGTFSIRHFPLTSSAAGKIATAAFFAPLIRTLPFSGLPP